MKSISNKKDCRDKPVKAVGNELPVVGIGASAGGLEALETFFTKEFLRATIEELETSNEELKSTNKK